MDKHSSLHVGMRNLKTSITVAVCALVYYFLDRSPAFACIGVIFGMGSDMSNSRLNGGNRIFDTAVGVLLALLVNWLLPRERILHWLHRDENT